MGQLIPNPNHVPSGLYNVKKDHVSDYVHKDKIRALYKKLLTERLEVQKTLKGAKHDISRSVCELMIKSLDSIMSELEKLL